MLKAIRKRPVEVQRAAGEPPWFWPSFSPTARFGGRDPLALPAFYRGMLHRTGLISTLPLVAEVDGKPAGVPIELLAQPDPSEDRQTTLSRMESSAILRGEIVCVLGSFDEDGFPRSIKVVDPQHAERLDDGSWRIGNREFPADEVAHAIPNALPGQTRGISAVELFRRQITAELAAIDYQGNFYLDGGQPVTVLTNSDQEATKESMQTVLDRYMEKTAGGRREPIVLPATIDVKTFSLTNRDAQFLESRQFSMVDVANMVGVPAYMVNAPGSSSVYSNDFDQRRALFDVYLRADVYAIERLFSRLLPDGLDAKFDANSWLRLDPKGTAEVLQLTANIQTVNEQRAVLGLEPIPNGDQIASQMLPGVAPAATPEVSGNAV